MKKLFLVVALALVIMLFGGCSESHSSLTEEQIIKAIKLEMVDDGHYISCEDVKIISLKEVENDIAVEWSFTVVDKEGGVWIGTGKAPLRNFTKYVE